MKRSTMLTVVILVAVALVAAYFVANLWVGKASAPTCPQYGSSCGDIYYPGNGAVVALMSALHV
jgi:hypothetical protein